MIFIIEGIDRVGKTTLANKLSEKFNIPIYKQERLGGNDVNLDLIAAGNKHAVDRNIFSNYIRANSLVDFWNSDAFKQNIILDRFHWTESVYSLVDRGSREPMQYMACVEAEMLKNKDKYFIIQVMPTDIKRSSAEHGKDLVKHQVEFDMLYDSSRLNKYRCSYGTIDLCIDKVEKLLKEHEVHK